MTKKIGLISDIHATAAPLREALTLFQREGVEMTLCAGDIVGYGDEPELTVTLLSESRCQTIVGNHDLWWLVRSGGETAGPVNDYLRSLPRRLELTIAGKRISMVHASPPDSLLDGIRLLDEEGELITEQRQRWSERLANFPADILVVGHTHQVFAERLGHPLVVNPGSTRFNHTCALLHLPELRVEILPLSGRRPVPAWNWGMERG